MLQDFKELITAKPHAHTNDDADLHIFNRCCTRLHIPHSMPLLWQMHVQCLHVGFRVWQCLRSR